VKCRLEQFSMFASIFIRRIILSTIKSSQGPVKTKACNYLAYAGHE
jgi:hypothetical protein